MTQKFIDRDGLKVLWNQVNLKDYPNNETLMAVIDAIDETKANKDELFSKSWNDLEDKPFEMNSIIERSTYYEGTAYTNMFGCRFYGTNLSNILDKAVVVTLNGVTYNSECVIDSATAQCAISFGDYKITEPIAGGEGVASLTPFEDGKTYSIKIEVIKEISAIPDKHIPDTIAKTTYVDEAISNHTHYLENIIDNPFETQQSMIISSKTEVLAETECSNLANTEHWIHESDYYIEFAKPSKLYQVVFAGDTYNLHPVLEDEDSMIYSLGDKDYNTYPFYIKYYSDEWFTEYYFQEYSSNDTISIYECIASSEDVCVLPISNGGTGATDATTARTNLEVYSIAEVDTALESLRTNIDNIDLSGLETKEDAQVKYDEAKAYADTAVANLVNSAPETLDTLGELATAFNENKDIVDALNEAIVNKADKNDIVQSDWNCNDETSAAYVKNRPFYANDFSFRDRFVPSAYEKVDNNLLKVISSNSAIKEIKNKLGIDINVPTNDHVLGKKLDIIITNEQQEEKVVSIDNPYYLVGVTDNGYPYLRFCHKDKMPIFEYRIEENDLVYKYVYNYFAVGALYSYGISSSEWGYNPSTGVWLGTEYIFNFTVESVVKLNEKYIPEIISRTGHTHLWNDLEDKPFDKYSFDELDCVYDSNNANNVVNTNGEKIWYLGDPTYGNESIRYITDSNGRIYKVPFNKTSSYCYKATFNLTGGNEITIYNLLLTSGGTIDGITFPAGGTYATAPLFEEGLFITKIEYAIYDTLHENYIPDSIARTVDVDEKIGDLDAAISNKADIEHIHSYNTLTDKPIYKDLNPNRILVDGEFTAETLTLPGGNTRVGYKLPISEAFTFEADTVYRLTYKDFSKEDFRVNDKNFRVVYIDKTYYNVSYKDTVGYYFWTNTSGIISEGETAYIKLEDTREYLYKTLDEEYLPENLGSSGEGKYTWSFADPSKNNAFDENCLSSVAVGRNNSMNNVIESLAVGRDNAILTEESPSVYGSIVSGIENDIIDSSYSITSGECNINKGYANSCFGQKLIASSSHQHIIGRYNLDDSKGGYLSEPGEYVYIVGNGSSETARSNAHTIDWDGNAWYQGDVYVGGSGQDDENAKKLATEEYVNNNAFIVPSEMEALALVTEIGFVEPVTNNGYVLTDENGAIYTI